MNTDVLKIVGQVAGIGGLSLGILLLLFKEIIRKNIFPSLKKEHAYSLLKLITILIWSVALVGIIGWIFLEYTKNNSKIPSKEENSVPTKIQKYLTKVNIVVRKKPNYQSEILQSIPCGTLINSAGESSDGRYVIYENGYIEKSQLLKNLNNPLAFCEDNEASLDSKELHGKWVQKALESSDDVIKYTFFNETFSDETILYDGFYNGKRVAYKSIGGKYLQKDKGTPITWDISRNEKSISIELWTDVTSKGFRQKWDLEWIITSNKEGLVSLRQKIIGLDGVKELRLIKCSSKHIQTQYIKRICSNETIKVGQPVTQLPPHKSQRAELPH